MNNGKICVSVAAETADEMIGKIHRAESVADVIEMRFDCLSRTEFDPKNPQPALSRILASTAMPVITTFHPRSQGGCRELSDGERSDFWNNGWETDLCDVELDVIDHVRTPSGLICSYHDLQGVPDDVGKVFDRLTATRADIIKLAITANDATDAISVWKLLEKARSFHKEFIPVAMGEAGKWTRILGLAHGAFLTYAALDAGSETAGGQLTVDDLANVYRVKELDLDTKVYGVIGDPVSSSLSPYIHNAAFKTAGINAVLIPLQVKDIDAFFKRMVLPATREVELNFAGFSVTMPHKQSVMRYLDNIDSIAERIGAVNTINIGDGRLSGYNTDAHGFATPLKAKLGDLRGSAVAVLGAGGAARACVFSLKQEGADVTVFTRDARKATQLASQFGVNSAAISNLRSEISNFDLLVNATPLGMKGEFETVSPLTADELKGVKLVFDLVASANDTPLVREAKKAGVQTIAGIEMLIEQATKQFEIWTGREAPIDVMRAAALDWMERAK